MVNKRVFYIKTKANIEITIPINNKVTVITGDSATGKTKLVNHLRAILKDRNEIVNTSINLDAIIICRDAKEVEELIQKNTSKKIVFIDRFDTINKKDIVSYIRQTDNFYILFAHGDIPQCGYDYTSILGMYHDGIKYEAKQLFSTPTEYLTNKTVLI